MMFKDLLFSRKCVSTRPEVGMHDRDCILWYEVRRESWGPGWHVFHFGIFAEWSEERRTDLGFWLIWLLPLFLFLILLKIILILLYRVPPTAATLS